MLELSDYWAGPLCGRTFGDLGADVILVEKTAGAPIRTALFDKLNRNKRSIALDLKTPAGAGRSSSTSSGRPTWWSKT